MRVLSTAAKLRLADLDLDAEARCLSDTLTNHALWEFSQGAGASRSEVSNWAAAVERWAAEGLTLLGGGADPVGWPMAASDSYHYLTRDVPISADGEVKRTPFDLVFPLADALRKRSDEVDDVRQAEELFRRLPPSLGFIRGMASNVPRPPPAKKRHDGERIALFRNLCGSFERLHVATKFKTRTGAATSHKNREGERYGPALTWCRAVFDLARQRIVSVPENLTDAPALEALLNELAAWSEKTAALAERIRGVGRTNANG